MDTLIGLDLGRFVDYTAAAIVRRSLAIDERGYPQRNSRGRPLYRFDIAAIKQYPLGTEYTTIVAHIVGQLRRPELGDRPRLVLDATGVGAAVVEMFRTALKPFGGEIECYAITITSGRAMIPVTRYEWHVAKIQLVGAIREALESGRLKVPPAVDPDGMLKRELQDFQVKITESANETFNAREGAHDDLVLAVSLPIWLAALPHLEMVVDDFDMMRPRELAAVRTEVEEIEEAEREAMAMERGEMTPKRQAHIDAIKADPFSRLRPR